MTKSKKEEESSNSTFRLYNIYELNDEKYLFTKENKEKLKSNDNIKKRKQKKSL